MRTKKTADLPDLQDQGNHAHEIVADNIRAVQAIYSAALLEELKAFQVVDRLVELFNKAYCRLDVAELGATCSSIGKSHRLGCLKPKEGVCTREFLVFREARRTSSRIESSMICGFGFFQALLS